MRPCEIQGLQPKPAGWLPTFSNSDGSWVGISSVCGSETERVRIRNRTRSGRGEMYLLTGFPCGVRHLKRISRGAVHIERPKRRDLIHVGIQHANGGCISAPTRREPHGPVFRELYLRRVSRELRFRIERERLVFRIELTDHRASISRRRVGEPHVAVEVLRDVVWLRVLLGNGVFGYAECGLVQFRQLSRTLAGGPDAPPNVVLIIHIRTPSLAGVCRWRKFGPRVGVGVEPQDFPATPIGYPKVVVPVGHNAVRNGVGAWHGKHGYFSCLSLDRKSTRLNSSH